MPVLRPGAGWWPPGGDLRRAARGRAGGAGLPGVRLFKALLLISANDAAVALAQATGSFRRGRG